MTRILFHSDVRNGNGQIVKSTPVTVADYYDFYRVAETALEGITSSLNQRAYSSRTTEIEEAHMGERFNARIEDRDKRVKARHEQKAKQLAETLFASGAAEITITNYLGAGSAMHASNATETTDIASSLTKSTDPSILYHGLVLAIFGSIGVDAGVGVRGKAHPRANVNHGNGHQAGQVI